MIQAIKRAGDIISLFTTSDPEWGVNQMARTLGLNRATTWGLVTSLHQIGFLEKAPDGKRYRLGPRSYEMGIVYTNSLSVFGAASNLARLLADKTGLDVRAATWTGEHALTILEYSKSSPVAYGQIGPKVPAYCTAIGKALIAFIDPAELETYLINVELKPVTPYSITDMKRLRADLKKTLERGYSVSIQELSFDRMGIGAPIYQNGGGIAGSLSVTGFIHEVQDNIDDLAQQLLDCTYEISLKMGYEIR